MHPHLPDEDGLFHPSLLPFWFLCQESHTLTVNRMVLTGEVVHQHRLVDFHERFLSPCPSILHPFQFCQALLMLFLSHLKPTTSLSYIYDRAIFACNGINYSCVFLDLSFVLWMHQRVVFIRLFKYTVALVTTLGVLMHSWTSWPKMVKHAIFNILVTLTCSEMPCRGTSFHILRHCSITLYELILLW